MKRYSANGNYISEVAAQLIVDNAPRGYSWKLKATTKDSKFYQFQKITKTRTIVLVNMQESIK